jgi:hypothetical protein
LRAFPEGLDTLDSVVTRAVRLAYEEWLDNAGSLRPDPAIHLLAWAEATGHPRRLLVAACGMRPAAATLRRFALAVGIAVTDLPVPALPAASAEPGSASVPAPPEPGVLDIYSPYEIGLHRFLELLTAVLAPTNTVATLSLDRIRLEEAYQSYLLLDLALGENLRAARRFGDNDTRRSERLRLLDSLNRLALSTFQRSFNELCRD